MEHYKKVPGKPVENQSTAAWANAAKVKHGSNIAQPDAEQVRNAKEYVDENAK